MLARVLGISVTAAACFVIGGCANTGEFYDPKKHTKDQFSAGNTLLAVAGTAAAVGLVVAAAQDGGGGGGYYGGYDYDYAWDYLPGNGQWGCRGKQTGQFAYPYKCQFDPVNDYTWPG